MHCTFRRLQINTDRDLTMLPALYNPVSCLWPPGWLLVSLLFFIHPPLRMTVRPLLYWPPGPNKKQMWKWRISYDDAV